MEGKKRKRILAGLLAVIMIITEVDVKESKRRFPALEFGKERRR